MFTMTSATPKINTKKTNVSICLKKLKLIFELAFELEFEHEFELEKIIKNIVTSSEVEI